MFGVLYIIHYGTQVNECPDSKVHGANMGPTWGRQNPMLVTWTLLSGWTDSSIICILTMYDNNTSALWLLQSYQYFDLLSSLFETVVKKKQMMIENYHWHSRIRSKNWYLSLKCALVSPLLPVLLTRTFFPRLVVVLWRCRNCLYGAGNEGNTEPMIIAWIQERNTFKSNY